MVNPLADRINFRSAFSRVPSSRNTDIVSQLLLSCVAISTILACRFDSLIGERNQSYLAAPPQGTSGSQLKWEKQHVADRLYYLRSGTQPLYLGQGHASYDTVDSFLRLDV